MRVIKWILAFFFFLAAVIGYLSWDGYNISMVMIPLIISTLNFSILLFYRFKSKNLGWWSYGISLLSLLVLGIITTLSWTAPPEWESTTSPLITAITRFSHSVSFSLSASPISSVALVLVLFSIIPILALVDFITALIRSHNAGSHSQQHSG